MKQSLLKLSCIALVGTCCMVKPAAAYVIPIASMVEWPQEIMLLFESEIKRWEHEAIKYKELLYTDMIGKTGVAAQGNGSLKSDTSLYVCGNGTEKVCDQDIVYIIGNKVKDADDDNKKDRFGTLATDAKYGASVIQKTQVTLSDVDGKTLVDDLSNYDSAKSKIETNFVVQPEKVLSYTTDEVDKIKENQKVAVNELAESALAISGVEHVVDKIDLDQSTPERAAKQIAHAEDMNAMFELMVAMDQRVYEKSLRASNIEAAEVELKSMQMLQGLSKVNPGTYEVSSQQTGDSQ